MRIRTHKNRTVGRWFTLCGLITLLQLLFANTTVAATKTLKCEGVQPNHPAIIMEFTDDLVRMRFRTKEIEAATVPVIFSGMIVNSTIPPVQKYVMSLEDVTGEAQFPEDLVLEVPRSECFPDSGEELVQMCGNSEAGGIAIGTDTIIQHGFVTHKKVITTATQEAEQYFEAHIDLELKLITKFGDSSVTRTMTFDVGCKEYPSL